MSDGNRLYLTCRYHASREESYLLGDRAENASYEARAVHASLQKWMDRHANCGGGLDNFGIVYHHPKDQEKLTIPPADHVADAVHKAVHEGVGTNTGHGHVWRRPDGLKARCGGPVMCQQCATDAARMNA